MKKKAIILAFLALASCPLFGSTEIMIDASGTPRLVSALRPLPTTATGTNPMVLASETIGLISTIASITYQLLSGVSVSTITAPLPTGTSEIGLVGADSGHRGSGTAAAPASGSFATQIYLTDNSSLQAWLTALVLGDGVNGNNTGVVHNYLYNGSTYDRMRGNSSGTYVIDAALSTGTCEVLNTSTVATDITATAGRQWVMIQNIGTETVWIAPFSAVASPSFSLGGMALSQYDVLTLPFSDAVPIGHVSSTPSTIVVTQGVIR